MNIKYTKSTAKSDIVKVLKHAIVDTGVTNNDIADKMGLSKQAVSNLLNPCYRADSSMSLDTLYRLCDAIGCEFIINIVPKGVNDNTNPRSGHESECLDDGSH